MTPFLRLVALAVLLPSAAASAEDRPPLGQVPAITEGLIDTAIAYEIDRVCEALEGRRLRGIALLLSLQGQARQLGYSPAEIEGFVDDDAEKDRLEAIARARLRDLGAVEGRPETYCAVGRAQIAEGTRIGGLLSD